MRKKSFFLFISVELEAIKHHLRVETRKDKERAHKRKKREISELSNTRTELDNPVPRDEERA
jgi:hypothetical protein